MKNIEYGEKFWIQEEVNSYSIRSEHKFISWTEFVLKFINQLRTWELKIFKWSLKDEVHRISS